MTVKSVVTCDLEGRIETFNAGAQEIFGYTPEEVVGKKRVSLFSPGLIVLGHVQNWLKIARKQGEYRSRTVFVRRDGSTFAAEVRITPTFRNGQQIGYCGVTTPLPEVAPAETMPAVSFATRMFAWLVITRAPFLTATLVPILVAAAWVFTRSEGAAFPWMLFWLTLLGGIAIHISANTFNDYFDWTSGTDKANNEYFMPYSGGSRSLELGLISERKLFLVASISLMIAALAGLPILLLRGPALLAFALAGAFSAYFYTAPPLRLAARKGLGELIVGMNFGPLMTAGTVFALTGQLSWIDFLIGLPVGLLTTAILWINQFPDMAADAQTGKHNLVVVLGKERARWGYLLIVAAAFGSVVAAVIAGVLPWTVLVVLAALPLAIYTSLVLFRRYADRSLIRANSSTILLHLVVGVLLIAGLLVGSGINSLFG
jgi:1,4-dihydroxy-2-naphthoate polyprenyltransferase